MYDNSEHQVCCIVVYIKRKRHLFLYDVYIVLLR